MVTARATEPAGAGQATIDLLGVLAIAIVLVLIPIAATEANSLAGLTGGVVGILLGLLLARLPHR